MNTLEMPVEVLPDRQRQRAPYTAKTHTTGGRDGGRSRSSDGRVDVELTLPGSAGRGTNPEQLLAAVWSSCFLSAIKLEARGLQVWLPSAITIDAEVHLCSIGEAHTLQARLDIRLPGLDRDIAQAIVSLAHRTCPYSRATRGNIEVAIHLI